MTTGRPVRLILIFMIPLLAGNLFQQFYNMADTFIVGRTLGVNALAAVGCTGALSFLTIGFAQGATSGLSIIAARRFGAGNLEGVRRSFAASALISAVVAAALTVVSVAGAKPLLRLLQTPPEILDGAYRYIVVIFGGVGAALLFNLVSNMMRAVGDSRSPLLFLAIACALNIALDYMFILAFDMGVAGAAVATVAAQVASGGLCILYIRKYIPVLRLTRSDWRLPAGELRLHLRLGLPMGFQSSIIAIGAILVQYALNGLGAESVAAFTAAQKIDTLATLPLMSFGITMATYVAQNHGAGFAGRIRQGVAQCCVMSVGFAVMMAIVNTLAGDAMAAVFVGGNPDIVANAHRYLIVNGWCYFLLSLLFIYRYSLQGLGQSLSPTVAGIVELVMRGFAAVVLTWFFGFTGACIASPLAWLGACVPLTIAYVRTIRRMADTAGDEHPPEDPAQEALASDAAAVPVNK